MTMRQKRSLAGVSSLLAVGAVVLLATVLVAQSHAPAQRIELIAACMSFRLAGTEDDPAAQDNPVLRLRAGQRVEIVLRGADSGMKHDFAIPQLSLQTAPVALEETTVLRFTAPAPGTYRYLCTMHPKIMRGEIVVEP
jgi:plastocyanin